MYLEKKTTLWFSNFFPVSTKQLGIFWQFPDKGNNGMNREREEKLLRQLVLPGSEEESTVQPFVKGHTNIGFL